MIRASENCKSNATMINLFLLMIYHWLVDDNSYYEITEDDGFVILSFKNRFIITLFYKDIGITKKSC